MSERLGNMKEKLTAKHPPNEYLFVTTWRIKAPVSEVWKALVQLEDWPTWWRALRHVSVLQSNGQAVYQLIVGYLIYFLNFQLVFVTVTDPYKAVLHSSGDIEGNGTFDVSSYGNETTIVFEWHIRTTKPWASFVSRFCRSFFTCSHAIAMKWFAQGMASHLNSTLLYVTSRQLL